MRRQRQRQLRRESGERRERESHWLGEPRAQAPGELGAAAAAAAGLALALALLAPGPWLAAGSWQLLGLGRWGRGRPTADGMACGTCGMWYMAHVTYNIYI
jgi:hypothetical protein